MEGWKIGSGRVEDWKGGRLEGRTVDRLKLDGRGSLLQKEARILRGNTQAKTPSPAAVRCFVSFRLGFL